METNLAVVKTKMKAKTSNVKDAIFQYILLALAILGALMIAFIFLFILIKAWSVLKVSGFGFITNGGFSEQIKESYYLSASEQTWQFGALGLFVATILTTLDRKSVV